MMQGSQAPDPLAQLKDIHSPTDVAVWPLDWGWWVVIALSFTLILTLAIWAYRRYRFYQAKREALASLRAVSADQPDWPARMNTVLKRTAMTYFDAHRVAPLYGMAWMAFLHSTLPQKYRPHYCDGLSQLSHALYRQTSDTTNFDVCHSACMGWLRHARLRTFRPHVATGSAAHHV